MLISQYAIAMPCEQVTKLWACHVCCSYILSTDLPRKDTPFLKEELYQRLHRFPTIASTSECPNLKMGELFSVIQGEMVKV